MAAKKLTVEGLAKLREQLLAKLRMEDVNKKFKIIVHMGTCGLASGAQDIYNKIVELMTQHKVADVNLITSGGLSDPENKSDYILTTSGCAGMCCNEPMITVKLADRPDVKYINITPQKMEKIFEEHILGGNVVKKYALAMGPEAIY